MSLFKLITLLLVLISGSTLGQVDSTSSVNHTPKATSTDSTEIDKVYIFDIKDEIGPAVWRRMQHAFDEAQSWDAKLILLHMNTYGGLVVDADSMRTKILNSEIPVWVFIDNNAASAGALISIACDSIFMNQGANIGAATVVDAEGQKLMDKYQSYMRSTMRSTAETKGRDPKVAEAMVDESIYIEGLIDSTKILTMTASEAMENGYCDGTYESIPELLLSHGISDAETRTYIVSPLESIIGMLVNPAVSGILIMIIIGGIYFELQSPGVGFPILAALIAAALYFAPLYLEGLAENWEIVMFVVGIILLAVEVFVIPGFGLAGAAGIAFMVTGLILSLISNVGFDFEFTVPGQAYSAFFNVIIATTVGFFGSFWLAKRLFATTALSHMVLSTSQPTNEGYIGVDAKDAELIGSEGEAFTVMRPSGNALINDQLYDATALTGYIDKGEKIKVVKFETAQLFVRKL